MIPFKLETKHLKNYPHFDAPISRKKLQEIVDDPERIASHPFYPFLVYMKTKHSLSTRKSGKPKKAPRPIRYAARVDAAIYSAYRAKLSCLYEEELKARQLEHCPVAYRKIPRKGSAGSGKCNIDFANDAFKCVSNFEQATVYTFDISSYFENIDHAVLKQQWCRLLKVERLPSDHYAVFKSITNYSYCMKDDVYERLGFFKRKLIDRSSKLVPVVKKRDMPTQLCDTKSFKAKIAGDEDGYDDLISKNPEKHGIPQGSPISDVLANLYLLNFDEHVCKYIRSLGGAYFRYSDDIIIIIPTLAADGFDMPGFINSELKKSGDRLEIKDSKTNIVKFKNSEDGYTFYPIAGSSSKNGLEYLGFSFDGSKVYLRTSTLSNLHRKISQACKKYAKNHIERYPGKDLDWLKDNIDYQKLEKKFRRVEDFEPYADKETWTFWTYAKRSRDTFGSKGKPIEQQLRKQRKFIKKRAINYLEKTYSEISQN